MKNLSPVYTLLQDEEDFYLYLMPKERQALCNLISRIIDQREDFDSKYIVCNGRELSIAEWRILRSHIQAL